ncbi:hippocampus abundant transcript 1 protein [Drosophila rhopaloa]|uniref:Major facilitator superfamily (MFS) profile domain-containing protein n=1 Tax=Drosophila rhopaloa TaxID=1041015 RepID=A0ABM5GVY3_DRORH|nr:hippocampus abundant transcript 1 protein [Drosophila rhopaloa]
MAQLKLLGPIVKILVKRSGIGAPSVWHAVIVTFLHYFAWGLLTVPFMEKLSKSFGNGVLLVDGLVYGVRGIVAFVSTPVMGAISDFRGRKVVMLLAVVTTYSPIPFMMSNSWWFFALLSVSSIFGSTYSASLAYVADVTSLEDRSKGYGIVASSFGAGIAFSPLLGNFLMHSFGPAPVILIASITGLLNILFIIFGVPESLVFKEMSLVLEETYDNQMLIRENWCQRMEDREEEDLNIEQRTIINFKETETMLKEKGNYHIVNPKVKERLDNGISKNKLEKPILDLQDISEEEPTLKKVNTKHIQNLNNNGTTLWYKNELIPEVAEKETKLTKKGENDNGNSRSHLWAVLRESRKDKNMLVVFLISFLTCWPFAGVDSTAPLYLKTNMGFEYEEVSLMLGLLSVLGITSNLLLGYLVSLVGPKWSIQFGLICLLSQLLLLGYGTQHWMFWLASIMAALATIIPAANNSLASIYASPKNQGAVLGIISGIECLSEGLGPAMFGLIFYFFQDDLKIAQKVKSPIPLPFIVGAIMVFVAIILTSLIQNETCEKRQKLYKVAKDENELEPLTKTINKVGKENAGYTKLVFYDYDSECNGLK